MIASFVSNLLLFVASVLVSLAVADSDTSSGDTLYDVVGLESVGGREMTDCVLDFKQCGGANGYTGPTNCCNADAVCTYINVWHSQCNPNFNCPGLEDVVEYPAVDRTGFVATHGRLKLGGSGTGKYIVDKNNHRVQLLGVSSHGLQFSEVKDCYTEESITFLAQSWGITVFRAAMYIGEGGYATKPEVFDKVKEIVAITKTLGIYVIIDWHVLNPGDPNYWLTGAGNATANAKTFWETVATLYKDEQHVIYEICNEPNGVSWPSVKSYADTIISAIRAIDTQALIIVGTTTWSQDIHVAYADPVSNPYNVLYAFHFFTASHASLLARLQQYAPLMPIFASDWGVSTSSGGGNTSLATAENFLAVMKEHRISFTTWSYADKYESSAFLRQSSCDLKNWDDTVCAGTFIKNYIRKEQLSPTQMPTVSPTHFPTRYPTPPTAFPTKYPTKAPTKFPTKTPTKAPTKYPTKMPTEFPTKMPTKFPTKAPTKYPTKMPTKYPTKMPTKFPTALPTKYPTKEPTEYPTKQPTKMPTKFPTKFPTKMPTKYPTPEPTNFPTKMPTKFPTKMPTKFPTKFPTRNPTKFPTKMPTKFPTKFPTRNPTKFPTTNPPTLTASPTRFPDNRRF